MLSANSISDLAHVIQLAVAPVFLLTGIGAILAVMTNRLSRVVDRTRQLEAFILNNPQEAQRPQWELGLLFRRTVLASRAIALCTMTALLVCAVIALIFVGSLLGFQMALPVAILFVASMLTFMLGLLTFLQEVRLAARSLEGTAKQVLALAKKTPDAP